jgi:hypothetical protein
MGKQRIHLINGKIPVTTTDKNLLKDYEVDINSLGSTPNYDLNKVTIQLSPQDSTKDYNYTELVKYANILVFAKSGTAKGTANSITINDVTDKLNFQWCQSSGQLDSSVINCTKFIFKNWKLTKATASSMGINLYSDIVRDFDMSGSIITGTGISVGSSDYDNNYLKTLTLDNVDFSEATSITIYGIGPSTKCSFKNADFGTYFNNLSYTNKDWSRDTLVQIINCTHEGTTLPFGDTLKAKLTEADLALAVSKNITIS